MATFVMTLGIGTSLLGLMTGFRTLDVARSTTLASQVLQSEMERLRLMSWSDIELLSGTHTVDLATVFTDDPALAARFTLTRTVGDVAGRIGGMKEVVLQTSWQTVDGRVITRSFRTYYAKHGLYDYYYTLARS